MSRCSRRARREDPPPGQPPGVVARCPVRPSASASPPSSGSWRRLRGHEVFDPIFAPTRALRALRSPDHLREDPFLRWQVVATTDMTQAGRYPAPCVVSGRPSRAVRCLAGLATGGDMEELRQALTEAISLYLSEPGNETHVELEDVPGTVTEQHILARTA